MAKPSVFIGSSTEGLKVAQAIEYNLQHNAIITVWNENIFELSHANLENLINTLDHFDFAILVLTGEDETTSREVTSLSPRDNVLFELGLFMGRLGRERTYVVHSPQDKVKIPSDLAGVSLASYSPRSDNNLIAALSPACTIIRTTIERLGPLTKEVELFEFHQHVGETFYEKLVDSYRSANRCIYVSGRGFVEATPSTRLGQHISELLSVTEEALARGVAIARIQTSKNISSLWADQFATLMDKYPDSLKVFADYSDPALVNVGIVDPEEEGCLIELMFESQKFSLDKAYYPAVTAIFLRRRRELARSLQRSFIDHFRNLKTMSSDDMRLLGSYTLYFAYGSNMSTQQMLLRCPHSKFLATGVIYNWKLAFSVKAPHLGGVAAGIYESPEDTVSGVVYRMTYEDKANLDRIEGGGYIPVTVNVKMESGNCDAFTYVPAQQPDPDTSLKPPPQYLNKMIDGAREHGLKELSGYLEQFRA
jgi:gamma-glutamylcyclotransferase (GGCT)/AIG2-like uncharacterized protein YtfP